MHRASAQQTKTHHGFYFTLLTSLPLLEVRADAPTFFVFWSIVPRATRHVNSYFTIFFTFFGYSGHNSGHNKAVPTTGNH